MGTEMLSNEEIVEYQKNKGLKPKVYVQKEEDKKEEISLRGISEKTILRMYGKISLKFSEKILTNVKAVKNTNTVGEILFTHGTLMKIVPTFVLREYCFKNKNCRKIFRQFVFLYVFNLISKSVKPVTVEKFDSALVTSLCERGVHRNF